MKRIIQSFSPFDDKAHFETRNVPAKTDAVYYIYLIYKNNGGLLHQYASFVCMVFI